MLSFEQIKELIELVAARHLEELEIERSGFRLRIGGKSAAAHSLRPPAAPGDALPMIVPTAAEIPLLPASGAAAAAAAGLYVVESPIVGTFYAAPSPDADPFTSVGQRVRKGQVLCIVEAMKLMNEIEADVNGEVVEIYPKNAQPVEYGEPLFAVRPD